MNGHSVSCRVAISLSGEAVDSQEATQILRIIAGTVGDYYDLI